MEDSVKRIDLCLKHFLGILLHFNLKPWGPKVYIVEIWGIENAVISEDRKKFDVVGNVPNVDGPGTHLGNGAVPPGGFSG